MPGLPTFVCAVDRSERGPRVAEAARHLAQRLDAHVVLVHVFDPMTVPVPPTQDLTLTVTSEDIAEEHRGRAHQALGHAAHALAGAEHATAFREGDPRAEILEVVREHRARLLIAGSAARRPLDRLMKGSLAGELAQSAPCPVVVVTDDATWDDDGPVLAAYDGSEQSLVAARHGAALAAGLGRELVLVHVVDAGEHAVRPDAELARELHAAARTCEAGLDAPLDVVVAVEHGDPVEQLTQAARARAASLVVVGSRGRNALRAALLGSVSAGMVRRADRPVVVAGPRSADAL